MAEQRRPSDPDREFISQSEAGGYLSFFGVLATITHLADVSIGFAVAGTLLLMSIWIITGIACEAIVDNDEEAPPHGPTSWATDSYWLASALPKLASSAGLVVGAAFMIAGISSIILPLIGASALLLAVIWVVGIDRHGPSAFRDGGH